MSNESVVLTPFAAYARYAEELSVRLADNSFAVKPGVIGTVYFAGGSKPEGRRGLLACFDKFDEMFGKHLITGKDEDLAKFSKKTTKGVEKIRKAISDSPGFAQVSVMRSSAPTSTVAPDYEIGTLTGSANPFDYESPDGYKVPKGEEMELSYLKFCVPMELVTQSEGQAQYEHFLHYVCEQLDVRGGYGGLSAVTAYDYHKWQAQEWAIAERFSGIEVDACAHFGRDEYDPVSYTENEKGALTAMFRPLKPGTKVHRWGFIKGVNWYTLLSDVFVERLGGDDALRAALDRNDIQIERINHCVLVRAGPFPRLGAPEEGLPEPYVFVNSVLRKLRNPKPDGLHLYDPQLENADNKNARTWQARFDLPDAPPIPEPPTIVPPPVNREPARQSVRGGNPCPEAGWWHTPAKAGSRRYFEAGEIMPVIEGSSWGTTNWHWSPNEKQDG
ncbi:type VI immunity family protein [Burkholderia lata]|uniref:Pentapeptide repeat-containing protein n=1 Tax=Burkholderia lata (strain ATCC 17760 / DSM 23089 / LMG 22485 / NCIMB 9086 / R18194 / 383) TaxID=482957 RepID=A0A6P2S5U6_BURL3|nr:type VI immunity family protein [Burkholderia lata]VWC45472.1 pentapeptide repeat-containing protein [Burkholderia lata]